MTLELEREIDDFSYQKRYENIHFDLGVPKLTMLRMMKAVDCDYCSRAGHFVRCEDCGDFIVHYKNKGSLMHMCMQCNVDHGKCD